MPVYEFTCTECGSEFSVRVAKMGDSAPCPNCKGTKVQRRLSSFACGSSAKQGGRGAGFS